MYRDGDKDGYTVQLTERKRFSDKKTEKKTHRLRHTYDEIKRVTERID